MSLPPVESSQAQRPGISENGKSEQRDSVGQHAASINIDNEKVDEHLSGTTAAITFQNHVQAEEPQSAPPAELTLRSKPPAGSDGDLMAWLQVLGCFFCWFNSWGLTNAFGVFQTYYQTQLLLDHTPSQISWIGALQSFLLMFVGVLTGPLYDAGYFVPIIWTGCFCVTFGHMMLSLCTQYWQVVLSQGLLVGIGAGCLFLPCIAILPQYFSKRRALANGVAASGSSMGGVVYPIMFRMLLSEVGFGWSTRILGFVVLGTSTIVLATLRVRVKSPKKRVLFDIRPFKEPPFTLFTFCFIFAFMGLYVPTFYIQSYAIDKGLMSEDLAAYILPILNAAGVFGRVLPNFFADKSGPLNILTPFLTLSAIVVLGWIGVTNSGGLIVIALLYGFFSGAILSLPPMVVVSLSPSLDVIGTRLGTICAVASIGLLIGTPVSGEILGSARNYTGLQVFAGVILIVAAAFCAATRVTKAGIKLRVKA